MPRIKTTGKTSKKEFHETPERDDLIYGRNPVIEALESGHPLEKILILDGGTGSISKIVALAKEVGVRVEFVDRRVLDRLSGGRNNQGVVAKAETFKYSTVDEILELAEKQEEDPFILLLDGIEDPHNLGAILRTAECAGVHGVVIPERRSASVNSTVIKVSAGACEHMKVARVTNMARLVDELKNSGIWVAALDMGDNLYYQQNLTGPIAIVVGNEGKGISRLVKEKCDYKISIPLKGRVTSLNASNAVGIAVYEVVRQRGNP